ncbi:hypothetical protein [Spirosoma koreense]
MENSYESQESIVYVKKQPVWAFCLLSFLTFGLYPIYWFYKNWRFFKELYDWDIYPVWRAIFSIFFIHALLERIDDLAIEKGHPGINSGGYATGYVVIAIVQRFLDRVAPDPFTLLALFIPTFLLLIPSLKQLNYINDQAGDNKYRPIFSPGESVALLIGGIMMALVVAGTLMS